MDNLPTRLPDPLHGPLRSMIGQSLQTANLVLPAAWLIAMAPALWAPPVLILSLMAGRSAAGGGNRP